MYVHGCLQPNVLANVMSKIFIIVREYKSDLIILYRIICTYYNTGEEAKPMTGRGGSLGGGTGQSEPDGPFRIYIFLDNVLFDIYWSKFQSSICHRRRRRHNCRRCRRRPSSFQRRRDSEGQRRDAIDRFGKKKTPKGGRGREDR